MLWGAVMSGAALGISVLIAGGMGYALEFAVWGLLQGSFMGIFIGILAGVVTSLYYSPLQNPAKYKSVMGIYFTIAFAFGNFLLSWARLFGPLTENAQYTNQSIPAEVLTLLVIPSLIVGVLAIPIGQRLTSWYVSNKSIRPQITG